MNLFQSLFLLLCLGLVWLSGADLLETAGF